MNLGDLLRQKLDANFWMPKNDKALGSQRNSLNRGDVLTPQRTQSSYDIQPALPSTEIQMGLPAINGRNLQGGTTTYDGESPVVQPSLKSDALYRLKLR